MKVLLRAVDDCNRMKGVFIPLFCFLLWVAKNLEWCFRCFAGDVGCSACGGDGTVAILGTAPLREVACSIVWCSLDDGGFVHLYRTPIYG